MGDAWIEKGSEDHFHWHSVAPNSPLHSIRELSRSQRTSRRPSATFAVAPPRTFGLALAQAQSDAVRAERGTLSVE